MKFLIKDKYDEIPSGYKQIDLPVVEIGAIASIAPVFVAKLPLGFCQNTVSICQRITNSIVTFGHLPFTTIVCGTVVIFSSAVIVSELLDLIYEKVETEDVKDEVQQKVEEILKHHVMMKKGFATPLSKSKEDK